MEPTAIVAREGISRTIEDSGLLEPDWVGTKGSGGMKVEFPIFREPLIVGLPGDLEPRNLLTFRGMVALPGIEPGFED